MADEIFPRFSPDGRYVVYSSNATGNYELWGVEIATGYTFQLTNNGRTNLYPDWIQ